MCLNKYPEGLCFNVLQSVSTCEMQGNKTEYDDVYISNTVLDKNAAEERIMNLTLLFYLIHPISDECNSAVFRFLCQYYFGLCGTHDTDYRPTAVECRKIRDSTCQSEWKRAEVLLALSGQPPLPDCSSLGDDGLKCNYGKF